MYRERRLGPPLKVGETGSKKDPRVYGDGVKPRQEGFSAPSFPFYRSNEVYFCKVIAPTKLLGKQKREMEQVHLESAVQRVVVCCVREG